MQAVQAAFHTLGFIHSLVAIILNGLLLNFCCAND